MYSFKIEQAVQAAALLHQEQYRKGKEKLPYITHLFSVFLIAREYIKDENTLVACLLHDTLEDTSYNVEDLEGDFGSEVRGIVETVTEPVKDKTNNKPWSVQKKHYAQNIKKGPIKAVQVACADKIHNIRSTLLQYYTEPEAFSRDFQTELEERLVHFQTLSNIFNARLEGGLLDEFNQVYKEYKNFLLYVQER